MHSRTSLGPLTMLPTGSTPPIEEGRLERVHPGTGSVILRRGSMAWRCLLVVRWDDAMCDVQIASVICCLSVEKWTRIQ
jgi:hypothetical protein